MLVYRRRQSGLWTKQRPGPKYRYVSIIPNSADATSITLSAQRLGEPAADRCLVIPVGYYRNGTFSLNSVTVDGVPTTLYGNSGGTPSQSGNAFAIVTLPAKAEGDISLFFSAAYARIGVGVYLITGLQSVTPVATGSDTGTPFNFAITESPLNGVLICCAKSESSNTGLAFEWTGGIVKDDEVKTESNGFNFSVASMYVRSIGDLSIQANHPGVTSNIGRGSYILMR